MKYKLKEICTVITDGSHWSPQACDDGYPMFSVKDMLEYGFSYENCKRISIADFVKMKSSGCVPQKGDVLIAKDGSYLKEIFVCDETREEAILSSIAIFRPNQRIVTPEYLCYLLKSPKVYNYIKDNCVSGSAVPRIVLKTFKEVEMDVPDLVTQKKRCSILLSIDRKIQTNSKINGNLSDQAKALFKNMFPSAGKSDEANGVLADIATITMGQSPDGKSYNEEGAGAIFYQGRTEFGDRFPSVRLFTTEPKRMAEAGDILMSVRAPVGDYNVATASCCIGRGLASIRSINGYSSFLLYTMDSLREQLNVFNGEGTVFGSINQVALKSMPVWIPSVEEMGAFEQIAAPIDAAILNNWKENCRLIAMRDSLLPKLTSGELDVSEIEF